MMRRQSCLCVLTTLTLVILSLTAPISTAQPNQPLSNTHLKWPVHSVTPDGRVRVIITKNKPKLLLAKSQRPIVHALNDNDPDYYDELPDIQVGYRRPELINQSADVELPDEIKIRLLLARKRALARHKEIWG